MDTRTTLLDLPSDILNKEVAKPGNLDTQSLINLRKVNKRANQLFKPAFFQYLKKYIQRSAKTQVQALLTMHLNFDVDHLRDAFRAALRFGDIDLCKVIVKGREDILKQIEIPKKLVDEKNTYDFSAVVAAIESGQNVEEILAKMRTDLDKIVKEKGFPFQALLNAYEIYDKNYDPWTIGQCKLFSVKVIGYLQRLSPAWLKKALAKGIYNIPENGKMCGDTFTLQSGESIDPAREVPNSGLGFYFCVNIFGGRAQGAGTMWLRGGGVLVEKLFRAKTAELGELMQQRPEPKTVSCVIV